LIQRYKIRTGFAGPSTGGTQGLSFTSTTESSKFITLPIYMNFDSVGQSDEIEKIVDRETFLAVNPIQDDETIRYLTRDGEGYKVNFSFFDGTNYAIDYTNTGFILPDDYSKNSFKRSFFRLYFYDTNDFDERNLLFFEELDVYNTKTPEIDLEKIYWRKNDSLFLNTTEDRIVYMTAQFFNAKDGLVRSFINLPSPTQVNITQFSSNPDWWSAPVKLINPRNNNGKYRFEPVSGVGSNTNNSFTLYEQVIS
jgi:hypothetical protein